MTINSSGWFIYCQKFLLVISKLATHTLFILLGILFSQTALFAQEDSLAAEKPRKQFGVKGTWNFQFPLNTTENAQQFQLLKPGNQWGGGAFVNIPINEKVQFAPYLGISFLTFRKSAFYVGDCAADSFPTFFQVEDTIPGRDLRFVMLNIEPAFKLKITKINMHLRLSPVVNINLQSKAEDYVHSCGNKGNAGFLTIGSDDKRTIARVMIGGSIGFLREVNLGKNFNLVLEAGGQGFINPLIDLAIPDGSDTDYSLQYAGLYVNIGFFR